MWSENILWTDEAHFNLEGAVNTQNCRVWGSTKPLAVHQRPLHSAYVTVWCGVTSTFILGPLFFLRITPRGLVHSSAPRRLQVTKTSVCRTWFLPCKNVNVLRPLFYAGWGRTVYLSPSSTSVSCNFHRWTHYLQKFSKSLACKISWPESTWLLSMGILEG